MGDFGGRWVGGWAGREKQGVVDACSAFPQLLLPTSCPPFLRPPRPCRRPCLVADCKAAVPRRVVTAVCDPPHQQRYEEFGVNSFVDDQRQLVWCPAPGA